MGAGSSTSEYTQEEKILIAKSIEEKYSALQSSPAKPVDSTEMYNTLIETYLQESKLVNERRNTSIGTSPLKPNELLPSVPLGSKSPSRVRSNSHGIDTDFKTEEAVLVCKTSSEMLIQAGDTAILGQNKIDSFMSQLRVGDITAKQASEFRARRLTYATDNSDPTPMSPDAATKAFNFKAKRTSIFASSEIGVRQEKKPPFPQEIMGTFSCHGIEPCPTSEDGIHEKINQDRGCIVHPLCSSANQSLFLVLDGHGEQGDRVSDFVMRQLVISLEKHPLLASDPTSALKDTFTKTNTALMVTPINFMTSGCTCVGAYLIDNRLYIANCGDSRCVLGVRRGVSDSCLSGVHALELSKDHKPDNEDEAARIAAWGGYVCPAPEPGLTARVYLDPQFTMIGLAMSRSIGDFAVKAVGVIAEPDVVVHDLRPEDSFMILASDGVWEFICSQEAVDIVANIIETEGAMVACQELIEIAASRWQEEEGDYRDDITAIIVKFPLNQQ